MFQTLCIAMLLRKDPDGLHLGSLQEIPDDPCQTFDPSILSAQIVQREMPIAKYLLTENVIYFDLDTQHFVQQVISLHHTFV